MHVDFKQIPKTNATQIGKNKNNSNPISLGKTQYNPNTKK